MSIKSIWRCAHKCITLDAVALKHRGIDPADKRQVKIGQQSYYLWEAQVLCADNVLLRFTFLLNRLLLRFLRFISRERFMCDIYEWPRNLVFYFLYLLWWKTCDATDITVWLWYLNINKYIGIRQKHRFKCIIRAIIQIYRNIISHRFSGFSIAASFNVATTTMWHFVM